MVTVDKCVFYEKQFWNSSFNEYFLTAQFSAIVAPVLGFLAWIAVFSELLCCQYRGSFVVQNILFLLAFIVQWCTFFLFGQTGFCFHDGAMKCEWKAGSILSIAAGGLYYICSILLCCMPRPNSCLGGNKIEPGSTINVNERTSQAVEKPATGNERQNYDDENGPHDV